MQYFFANGSEQRGPYSLDEIAAFGLRPDTLVWREGLSDWQRADTIPEIQARIPVAAAPESSHATDPVSTTDDSEIPLAPPDPHVRLPTIPPVAPAMIGYQPSTATTSPNGMAVASLVLGIISIPGLCIYALGLVAAVLAIVFGFIARSRARNENTGGAGMALAGLICGFVSIGIMVLFVIVIMIVAMSR